MSRAISKRLAASGLALCLLALTAAASRAQPDRPRSIEPAPPRAEGEGPFARLILRGGILVNGTGAPPVGPVDIVIEGNRITNIRSVGYPGVPIDDSRRPEAEEGDRELDVSGMYVLPGLVDMHGHIGGVAQGTPAEYVFKLWMGHGITTIRDPASGNGADWVLDHKAKSARNEITAPRIEAYSVFGQGRDEPFTEPEQARAWVREMHRKGVDGFKFFGYRPDILEAAIDEAGKLDLRSACHHAQLEVTRVNVLDTARWGLTTMEHWYGLPEALFEGRLIQDYPLDYNYNDEQHRFGQAGRLWKQAAEPGSEHWNAVMEELLALDFTLNPTLTIYEASRDLMRERRAEWHDEYTLPSLWSFFRPSRKAHGSYWFDWTTQDEIEWKENFRRWMTFLNEYKNRGGRVTTGSDSGYIYKIYGFGYIRELELLQEAGFHPLEVLRSATFNGADALGLADQIGSVEPGRLADLVVVEENPLANFKVLYGTGAVRVGEDNRPTRVGGVKWTIKDGIVYDARELLADVREIVREAKQREGREIIQPGLEPAEYFEESDKTAPSGGDESAERAFDPQKDLLSLHYDHAPDRDDGQSAAADRTLLESLYGRAWLSRHAVPVSGAYGLNRAQFNPASDRVMDAAFREVGGWLAAHEDRDRVVKRLAERWLLALESGGHVWVKEGGQSDLTTEVVKLLRRTDPELATREVIHVVQHSNWNEEQTTPEALAYAREWTHYVRIGDANSFLNLLGGHAAFEEAATSHSVFGPVWRAAFAYYDPDERLDFSDTAELLHLLGLGEMSVDAFRTRFLAQ